jgi:hypothetical protein
MMEYSLDEAADLLDKSLASAATNLTALDEKLSFLRDQLTTTEVSAAHPHTPTHPAGIARIHNFEVRTRRPPPPRQ